MLFADFGIDHEDSNGSAAQAMVSGQAVVHRNGAMSLPFGTRYQAVELVATERSPSARGVVNGHRRLGAASPVLASAVRHTKSAPCPTGYRYDTVEQQCIPSAAPRLQARFMTPARGTETLEPAPAPGTAPTQQSITTAPSPTGRGTPITQPTTPASALPPAVASTLVATGTVRPDIMVAPAPGAPAAYTPSSAVAPGATSAPTILVAPPPPGAAAPQVVYAPAPAPSKKWPWVVGGIAALLAVGGVTYALTR